MLLADWSFCCAQRLAPAETHTLLDVLQTLRSRTSAAELIRICLEQMAKADLAPLLYAVPAMLTAARRHRADPVIGELLRGRLAEAAGPKAPEELLRFIRDQRIGDAEAVVRLVRATDGQLPRTASDPSVRPYLDLADFRVETLLLTLLHNAARYQPTVVAPYVTGTDVPGVLERATSGQLGRQALLLAAQIRRLGGVAPEKATGPLLSAVGAAAYEPDVLAVTARIHFEVIREGTSTVDPKTIEREAVGFVALHQLLPSHAVAGTEQTVADPRTVAYQRLVGPLLAAPDHLPALLWHTVLWELAAEHDPKATATLLERWWSPPPEPDQGRNPRRLTYPISCRGDRRTEGDLESLLVLRRRPELASIDVVRGDAHRTTPAAGSVVFAPWLDRRTSRYHAADPNDEYEPDPAKRPARERRLTYPAMTDAAAMIRLLSSAGILATLLRATAPRPPDYLVALLLHLGDVLSNYRIRDFLATAARAGQVVSVDGPLKPPMAGLALHAQKIVDRLGEGLDDDVEPAAIAAYLDRRVDFEPAPWGDLRLKPVDRTEAHRILVTAAPRLATHWVQKAADTATSLPASVAPMPQGRWFAGDPAPAATVSAVLLVRVREYLEDLQRRDPPKVHGSARGRDPEKEREKEIRKAMGLFTRPSIVAVDLFPDLVPDRGVWNWIDDRRAVSAESFLLADPLDAGRWVDAAPNTRQPRPDRTEAAKLAMATERLLVALRAPRDSRMTDELVETWLAAWLAEVSAVNDAIQLSVPMRRRIVDLLTCRPGESDGARIRALITARSTAIDVIVEFSGWSTRIYDLLLTGLLDDAGLSRAATDSLRLRLFQGLIRRRAAGSSNRIRVFDPWHVRETIHRIAQTDAMINRFVAEVADHRPHQVWDTLGGNFVDSWCELVRSPRIRAVPNLLPHHHADPRLVLASVPDPEHGGTIDFLLDRDLTADTGSAGPMLDLLTAPPPARPPTGLIRLAGVVCAVTDDDGDDRFRDRAVWANCGTGAPVQAQTRRPVSIGDPVIVPGRYSGARFVASGLLEQPAERLPGDGEVRIGRIRIKEEDPTWLTLSGSSERDGDWKYPVTDDEQATAVRRLWDPDLSRGLNGHVEPGRDVLCRWDAGLDHWLPADRSFTHLIADGAVRDGDVLVFVDEVDRNRRRDWRFSLRPGDNYVLEAADWTEEAYRCLEERLASRSAGLLVYVTLTREPDGQPRLELCPKPPERATSRYTGLAPDGPFDDRNVGWQDLFDEAGVPVAERTGTNWVMNTGMTRMRERIEVRDSRNTFRDQITPFELDSASEGWSDRAQRTATVSGVVPPARRVPDPYQPDRDRYRRQFEPLPAGTVVTLADKTLRSTTGNTCTLDTSDGRTVLVATDSLTLAGLTGKRAGGRQVRIDNPGSLRPGRFVNEHIVGATTTELFDAVPYPPDPSLMLALDGRRSDEPVDGVVVVLPQDRSASIGMWWDVDGDLVYAQAPAAAFEAIPAALGDVVQARQVAGGWSMSVRTRLIHGHALWRIREITDRDRRSRSTVRLGQGYLDGEPGVLFENGAGDELLFDGGHDNGDESYAWPAEFIGQYRRGPDGMSYERVKVRLGGRNGMRFALTASPRGSGPQAVTAARYQARTRPDGLVDVDWRVDLGRPDEAEAAADETERNLRLWEAWLDQDDRVVDVVLTADRAKLQGRSVLTLGGFTSVVPRASGDEPRVLGRRYSTEARALLRQDGPEWKASCRDVPPLPIEEFAVLAAGDSLRVDGEEVALNGLTVYYAGIEPLDGVDHHILEWGHGWTAAIPTARVLIVGDTEDVLFFGDRITRAAFRREGAGDGSGHLIMVIDQEHVDWQIEHRLRNEHRQGVVHQTTAQVNLTARTVTVRSVGVVDRRLAGPDWEEVELPQAAFHDVDGIIEEAAATGRTEFRILSRLDVDALAGPRPAVRFHFVRPQITGNLMDLTHLHKDDQVLMYAGEHQPSDHHSPEEGVYNDVLLPFTLDPDILGQSGEVLLKVPKRRFSYREGLLMQAPDTYRGRLMLIRVDGGDRGTAKFSPHRVPHDLYGWVASRKGLSYAVVGQVRDRKGRTVVEIDAGRRFGITAEGPVARQLSVGSVVRLVPAGRGQIEIKVARPGDHHYVPKAGRPAVVLPTNPLLNLQQRSSTAAEEGMFVVAGLPGVRATAKTAGGALMRKSHPRVVRVQPTDNGVEAVLDNSIHAGRIMISQEDSQPRIFPVGTRDATPVAQQWSALSFADRPSTRQADDVLAARWCYHDNWTGSWAQRDGKPFLRKWVLRDLGPSTEPVFFDESWRSRYRPAELRTYGLPVTALVEAAGDDPTWYPVAALTGDRNRTPSGAWLQVCPGRVAEVPAQVLTLAGVPGVFLDRLHWAAWATGDEIRLRTVDSGPHQRALEFDGWRAGPRGAFGTAERVLLPVSSVDPEARGVVLGAGEYTLTYPASTGELSLEPGDFVWLNRDNRVERRVSGEEPRAGDVALLTLGAEGPRVLGSDATQVVPTGPEDWAGPRWIRDLVHRPEFLAMAGGALPVTVHARSGDRLEFSYRHQRTEPVGEDRMVPARPLGATGGHVVLRSGSTLHRVPLSRLVPGCPASAADAVARFLQDRSDLWWLWREPGTIGLRGGLCAAALPGTELDVEPIAVVPGTGGVLCREPASQALRWLPQENASWVSDLTEAELEEHVVAYHRSPGRRLEARILEGGALSLVRATAPAQRFKRLDLGETLSVTVEAERPAEPDSKIHQYLVRTPIEGVLLRMMSEKKWPISPDSVRTEINGIAAEPRPVVEVCGIGERRTRLDLPRWLVYRKDADDARSRFTAYRSAYTGAGEFVTDEETAIVEYAGRVIAGTAKPLDRNLPEEIRDWLAGHGEEAFGVTTRRPLDVVPTVSAVLALHYAGAHTGAFSRDAARASVWLLHRTGVRATRSIHAEELSTRWAFSPDRHDRGGLWQRLENLSLANEEPFELLLSEDQRGKLLSFCQGVLIRPRPHLDPELAVVAAALQMSIGQLRAFDELHIGHQRSGVTRRLAALGRALMPAAGQPLAQMSLAAAQVEELRTVLDIAVRGGAPLSLLPPVIELSPRQRVDAAELLRIDSP